MCQNQRQALLFALDAIRQILSNDEMSESATTADATVAVTVSDGVATLACTVAVTDLDSDAHFATVAVRIV